DVAGSFAEAAGAVIADLLRLKGPADFSLPGGNRVNTLETCGTVRSIEFEDDGGGYAIGSELRATEAITLQTDGTVVADASTIQAPRLQVCGGTFVLTGADNDVDALQGNVQNL